MFRNPLAQPPVAGDFLDTGPIGLERFGAGRCGAIGWPGDMTFGGAPW